MINLKELTKKAIESFGQKIQLVIAMEEFAELIEQFHILNNNIGNMFMSFDFIDDLLKEVIDVEICIEQLKYIVKLNQHLTNKNFLIKYNVLLNQSNLKDYDSISMNLMNIEFAKLIQYCSKVIRYGKFEYYNRLLSEIVNVDICIKKFKEIIFLKERFVKKYEMYRDYKLKLFDKLVNR